MRIILEIANVFHERMPSMDKNPGNDSWDLAADTRIVDLLEMLRLGNIPTVLVLNSRQCDKEVILKDGDHLKIYPLASGG